MYGGRSRQVTLLLVVLGLAAGAGPYNYRRNASEQEAAAPRRFQALSDAQLEDLLAAYGGETARLHLRLDELKQQREPTRQNLPLDRGIEQFEHQQQRSANLRRVVTELAKREVALQRLEEERRIRNDPYFKVRRFFKYLITI